MQLILASASPARLATLTNAGINPIVRVSHVDEEALELSMATATPSEIAQALAQAKCEKVTQELADSNELTPNTIVIGCDSVFELNGKPYGKPQNAAEAKSRWQEMMNTTGILHTGHYVTFTNEHGDRSTAEATASTQVHLGELTEAEMEAYLRSGEPFAVAGGFTLDGLGGAFVQGVTGDPSNVVGISLPTVRNLLNQLGITWTDLWNQAR
jgi:septum formation protein